MYEPVTLQFADEINICVPDNLHLITTYVLLEQGDWFEDEIHFVRHLLSPGQQVIDIGANYGVFTLSMAKKVGALGHVWAFEPASKTARFLMTSLALNNFSQVTLDQRALSACSGSAQLSLNDNSELNELVRGNATASNTETVQLISLDEAMQQYGWRDIAFVKIDAEGEEAAIIQGGKEFFQIESPLIQYEVKAGQVVHLDLVRAFQDIGYASYRLLPGLSVLVPFSANEMVDGYLLNLFCCKPDRAEKLAKDGMLVLANDGSALSASVESASRWRDTLVRLPYAGRLVNNWEQTVKIGQSNDVTAALDLYAMAYDTQVPLPERTRALGGALQILTTLCSVSPTYLRLASLARVAKEYGARAVAVAALDKLYQNAVAQGQINPFEPFLAPIRRFDSIDPGESLGDWVMCATLEAYEMASSYSSFFAGTTALQRLEQISGYKFAGVETTHRLALLRRRFPT